MKRNRTMLHSEYLEHIERHFETRAEDREFQKSVAEHQKAIGIMKTLNLDRAIDILNGIYAPKPRNKPRDPVCMLRALILMTVLRFSSITEWVDKTKHRTLLAVLCGFEPDDVPGVGTYYDFQKRMIDGPYRKRLPNEVRRSEFNARSHERDFQSEKMARKHEIDPNHSRSEKLVKKLLEEASRPREEGFQKILEDLLIQVGVVPSIESGILDEPERMILTGDGTIMATAASAYGRPACSCRENGIFKCEHKKLYSSPTAQWCHDHRKNTFVFGDRYYHIVVTKNGHDFPLIALMPGGNESDYTLSLNTVDRFVKAARENGLEIEIYAFCGDGHHDSHAHYDYFLNKGIYPVIPLPESSKKISPHFAGDHSVRLDSDGTPLCPANARMRHHQYDKKQKKHVFCCPAKRGTHKNGKAVYVFRKEQCPRSQDCKPGSSVGPCVYIKSQDDPRLFPPLPRHGKAYKQIARQRSASERINSVHDFYGLDGTCRNADYGLVRLLLANIAHHATILYEETAAKAEGGSEQTSRRQSATCTPET